ncbi:peptidylprolyl isomerase [Terriglobus albidus]|uniref:peptidylprolyl isomerase n=1 Tax=Terriglobus albidus TaxID=1592106 RepID=UPI0021DF7294|nr:peptidylprolyl isomerase [Terriglobus albidus]
MTIRPSILTGSASLLLAVSAFAQQQKSSAPRYVSPIAQKQPVNSPTPKAITPDAEVVEDMVVRVNDQIVSRSDYERAQAQLEGEIAQNHVSPEDADKRRKDLLRDLIDQQLLISKGKELGINADAEVVRRLDEIRKQNHFDSMEALEKAARDQGVSFEDFKASIRNNIITGEVVRNEVGRKLQMTHADEVRYYNAHKNEFTQPEQIHLSEILIPTPATPTDSDIAAAQKKADDVVAQLAGGAKFEDLAKTVSGGPTAAQGGDLGMFKRGALAQVLEDKTFVLKAGENTAPIRTRQGFVILKVTEHIPAGVPPLEQIEPQVQEAMYSEQMNPALRAYLTKLREDAYIDLRPGYTDSGSSGRQTSFIFTAYTPPAPKKKANKSRFDTAKTGRLAQAPKDGAQLASLPLDKNGKPKKIKREKVRYGQAPRTALPAAPEDQVANGATQQEAAPGTAIAPVDSNPLSQANADAAAAAAAANADPLAPKTPVADHKSRYSAKQKEFEQAKVDRKAAFAREKAAAMPDAPKEEEVQSRQVQSSALGLNGDTAKKKKVKRKKGEEKKRIQQTVQAPSETQKEVNSQRNEDGTYKSPVPPGTGDTTNK